MKQEDLRLEEGGTPNDRRQPITPYVLRKQRALCEHLADLGKCDPNCPTLNVKFIRARLEVAIGLCNDLLAEQAAMARVQQGV